MNQPLLPETKHSVHTAQWLSLLRATVRIRRNIIVLGVSLTAEMKFCSVEIQTQLLWIVRVLMVVYNTSELLGFWTRSIFIDPILPAVHYGYGVDSASNRNEYQESSWG
jgi:hypothetical protein